ncbi:MAG TPA: biotin/lipoyl-containing protein [Acidimicrobiia bacterium]|nr:biotin/lipoyl-containing protein [Acidimicrobiia bacterium]
MRTPITVPQLGLVESVVLLEWLVPDGETVEEGEPLILVETDKAQTEIVAPATGTVHVAIPAGDQDIEVGTEVGQIELP